MSDLARTSTARNSVDANYKCGKNGARDMEEEQEVIEPVMSAESTSSAHPLQGNHPAADEREIRDRQRRRGHGRDTYSHTHFKVYKRRWFGLAQLVLLNIVVSWDVSSLFSLQFTLQMISGR